MTYEFIEGLDIKAGLFELALEVHLCLGTPRGHDQRVEKPGTQDLTTGLVIFKRASVFAEPWAQSTSG